MKEIIAHEMQYHGNRVTSNIEVINYCNKYYEDYKTIFNDCFRDMRTALELNPDCCCTREQLIEKHLNIYLLLENAELIGSVLINENEIDDLIVNPKHQGKGYGKQLLFYAISLMQNNGIEPISLHVADWNKKAFNLYLESGFKCVKTEKVN